MKNYSISVELHVQNGCHQQTKCQALRRRHKHRLKVTLNIFIAILAFIMTECNRDNLTQSVFYTLFALILWRTYNWHFVWHNLVEIRQFFIVIFLSIKTKFRAPSIMLRPQCGHVVEFFHSMEIFPTTNNLEDNYVVYFKQSVLYVSWLIHVSVHL